MRRLITITMHQGDNSAEASAVVVVHPEAVKLEPITENSVEETEEPVVADPGQQKNTKVLVRLESPSLNNLMEVMPRSLSPLPLLSEER